MDLPITDFEDEAQRMLDLATQRAYAQDHMLHVRFYKRAVLNAFRSREEGRKIFEDRLYVEIISPANRLNVVDREATDEDKQRFNRALTAYFAQHDQMVSGTPLSELTTLTPGQVAELNAMKIMTVEQLAGVADSTIQLVGTGGQELKQRAIRFLAQTDNNAALRTDVNALREQLELERKQRLEAEAQLAEVSAKIVVTSK